MLKICLKNWYRLLKTIINQIFYMKKILYIDCFSVSVEIWCLVLFLIVGLILIWFKRRAFKLSISGYEIDFKQEITNGIKCTNFKVIVTEDQPERSYIQIQEIINKSSLSNKSKSISLSIFIILAREADT